MVDFFAFSKEARQMVYDELNAIERSKMRAVNKQLREEIDSTQYFVEKLELCQEMVRDLPLNWDLPSSENVVRIKLSAPNFDLQFNISNAVDMGKKMEKVLDGKVISTSALDSEPNVYYYARYYVVNLLQQKGWNFELVDILTLMPPLPTLIPICPVARLHLTQSPYSVRNGTIREWLKLFPPRPLDHLTLRSEHYCTIGIAESKLVSRAATLRVFGDTDFREWATCDANDLRLVDPRPPNEECLQVLGKVFEKFLEIKEDYFFNYIGTNWDSLNAEKLIAIIQALKKNVFLSRSATSYRLVDMWKKSKFILTIHFQNDYSG